MSHELRTPLNAIIGFTNLLLKRLGASSCQQQQDYLTRVQTNGLHLLALINTLLDLARIEAGQESLTLEPVAVSSLVQDVMRQMEAQVPHEVQFRADLPPVIALLQADSAKLKQVLINLVGNACKFTERGHVTVRVHAEPGTCVPTCIEVVDTGVGIPPEQLATIFERFQQGDSRLARKYPGTGLGLAIVRALCDLMGYRVEVDTGVGRGSTFRVLLAD